MKVIYKLKKIICVFIAFFVTMSLMLNFNVCSITVANAESSSTELKVGPVGTGIFDNMLFYIKNKYSGQYLTVQDSVAKAGQNVVQRKAMGGNSAQLWRFVYVKSGHYKIVSQIGAGNLVLHLDASDGNEQSDRTNIIITNDSDDRKSQFMFSRAFDTAYIIATLGSSVKKVLTVEGASCEENANVFQFTCNSSQNDQWFLEPASYTPEESVIYARANYDSEVETYPWFEGDCANFVSQCMLAGGMHFRDEWYIYKKVYGAKHKPENKEIETYWDIGKIGSNLLSGGASPWISAPKFMDFWSARLSYTDYTASDLVNNPKKLGTTAFTIGDVVQMWKKNFWGETVVQHTMIVTNAKDGTLYLTYHTRNTLDRNIVDIASQDNSINFRIYDVN